MTTTGQPGISPGRAAYEAKLAAESARHKDVLVHHSAWDVMDDGERGDWEAAADAGTRAYMPEDWTSMLIQRDEAREQLAAVRERLENLAAGMEMSASTTAPSKKSLIEQGCAEAVRGIAGQIGRAGFGEATP